MCRRCWGDEALCRVCGAEATDMYATVLFGIIPVDREFYCEVHAAELARAQMMRATAPWN